MMGLDMYMRAINTTTGNEEELAYWRKVNELQGYMERHYNQENVERTFLDEKELSTILDDLNNNFDEEFVATKGFFYGDFAMSDDERRYTINAFQEALEYAKDGWKVYYTCWY
jgi:hypothetical protein